MPTSGRDREQRRHRDPLQRPGRQADRPDPRLSADGNSWERQEAVLLENGYRCISYDRRGLPLRAPGWAVRAADQGCKPREFLRLLQGTRAERDAVHGNGSALDDDGHLMAILRFSVFGVAWLGSAAAGLAGGAAAIPGVVPCDQDEDCQHACQGERRCLQPPGRKLQQVCDQRRQARHGRRGDRIRVFDPLPGAAPAR